MYALSISLLVFALTLAGAFAGVTVRPLLLEKLCTRIPGKS